MGNYLWLWLLLVCSSLLCKSSLVCHDPCACECQCKTVDDVEVPEYKISIKEQYGVDSPLQGKRFIVKCISDSRKSIPTNLPSITTDLIVEKYSIGNLTMESFHFTFRVRILSIISQKLPRYITFFVAHSALVASFSEMLP